LGYSPETEFPGVRSQTVFGNEVNEVNEVRKALSDSESEHQFDYSPIRLDQMQIDFSSMDARFLESGENAMACTTFWLP
jgi:hypothetical protein